MDTNCTLRRFLNAGGRVLWISDVPIYYVGHADGSRTQWGWGGSTAVLGVTSTYGPTGEPSITEEGSTWGLTNRWGGSRPLKGTDVVDVALASIVTDFQAAYYGPVGVGLPWTWTPPGDIKYVHLVVDWTMDWEGSWYEVSFSVQYRKVGTQTWVTAATRMNTDAYPSSGSDTVDFTVPLGQYEIQIVATHGNITVQEADAGTVALAQQVHGWVKFYDTAKTGGFVRIWDKSLNGATLTAANYDELDRLAAYEQGYVTAGNRVSPAFNLALAGTVGDSKLSWSANVPAGTTLTVQTSVDDGVTWQTATNGGPIPGLSPNLDVSEKSLLVRQILTTQSPTTTPKLYWLEISVTPGISPNDPTPRWEMVWYEYDALNRPVRVYTNRLATELWDVTQYEYGLPLDLPTRLDLPGPTEVVHAYWYNTRGLKVEEDSGLPEQISWTYDATGRVDRVQYPDGSSVDYTYTGDGVTYRAIASHLENGTTWRVETEKNLRGWVTSEAWEIDGVHYEIRYTYDDAGNRTSMTYPDGTTVNFAYNERNQLVRIPGFFEGPVTGAWTDNAGFRYDANGFLIGMRSVNGIETTFQPDQRNRLTQISSIPLTLTYTYTPGGNVASITDAGYGEPFTTTYGYDGANRLISAQVHMPTGIETVQYLYDAQGNRIKEAWTDARGVIDYSYLPGNYLSARGSTSYSWGTYGQVILKDDQPNAPGGETNYDYNARRLMTQVRVNGSPVAQFFYDPYGRRVMTVEGDTTAITLYSGNDIVYEVKLQPGQPTVTTKYLALNGKYLAKVVQEGTNQPQTYFYHVDLVGSVRAITDGQGQVVARFEYEPFGVTVQASGPLAGAEVHKFTGKPEDVGIDLYYFNARYYDPMLGRFLAVDVAKEGLNWYVCVLNNPLRLNDPNGLGANEAPST